ncbi:MAG TPA: hypothetical protein PK847_06710 [Candidatus Sumerlaeota bacterium]|nr:hypothetical protein [Candidatus Sumerlaeota bacterium]
MARRRSEAAAPAAAPFGRAALPLAAALRLGSQFPLRLELVLTESAAAGKLGPDEDPFVVLSAHGGRSRVYLGRVLAGEANLLSHVAVKLAPRRGTPSGLEGQSLTEGQRLERWEKEWQHYAALAESEEAISPILFVTPGEALAGSAARPITWPPLVYCPITRTLLQPRSREGGRLTLCRDDATLVEHGLPPHGERYAFLWDAEAALQGQEPRFYQVPVPGEPVLGPAQPFSQCQREMAELLADPAGLIDLTTPDGLARLADLTQAFPGLTNPEIREAMLRRDPTELFIPWNLDEAPALVMQLNTFHCDEFSDLLGGIEEKEFVARYQGPVAAAGQRLRLARAPVGERFNRRLLFSGDGSGLDALEIFRLKWSLVGQIVRSTLEFQRRTGSPHLRLAPEHVMIHIPESGGYLPGCWTFQTRLISLGAPTLEIPGQTDLPPIHVPPVGSDPLYQAEIIRNSSFGLTQRGEFQLTGLEPSGERTVIVAQLHHEGLGLRWLSPKDHVHVSLGRHLVGEAAIDFLSRRDENKEYSGRTLYLRSLPLDLDKTMQAELQKLRGIRVPNAQFRLLPTLHVPCDLYSLGMLLYRVLLVNDHQGIGDVALALDELRQDLASLADVEVDAGKEAFFWDALLSGHRRPETAEVFDRRQIFYHEHQRSDDRPNAIPRRLWHEAMVIGLQLVTQFEGFSFAAHHGDFDESYPSERLEPVVRRVEELGRRLDAALFSFTARNAEVRQALELVTQEIRVG